MPSSTRVPTAKLCDDFRVRSAGAVEGRRRLVASDITGLECARIIIGAPAARAGAPAEKPYPADSPKDELAPAPALEGLPEGPLEAAVEREREEMGGRRGDAFSSSSDSPSSWTLIAPRELARFSCFDDMLGRARKYGGVQGWGDG